MKIVEFPEQTTVIARQQKQYVPMPVYRYPDDPEGKIICCWKLTWKERLKVAFTGTIWHYVLTFNGPLQPQLLATEKPFNRMGWLQICSQKICNFAWVELVPMPILNWLEDRKERKSRENR